MGRNLGGMIGLFVQRVPLTTREKGGEDHGKRLRTKGGVKPKKPDREEGIQGGE